MTRPKFLIFFKVKISANVSTEVVVSIFVASLISVHNFRSASNPNQPADVPFQAIELTLASASSFAAFTIFVLSN